MNTRSFQMWLQEAKGMKKRSARDVESRRKRALAYIQENKVAGNTAGRELELLDRTSKLQRCSPFVRSQLRRALRLFEEWQGINRGSIGYVEYGNFAQKNSCKDWETKEEVTALPLDIKPDLDLLV